MSLEWLTAPLEFRFMVYALLIAIMIALPTALLSCFLVLKGWALMGDAMSHAVFPGIVIAYSVGAPLSVGAFASGLICALLIGFLKEHSRVKRDTLMGIVFSGMFALGLVLYLKIQPEVHLDHILFGDMLGIGRSDLISTAVISALLVVILALKWRDFRVFIFDPAHARIVGLRPKLLHYLLLCMITLTVVTALKATGLVLAISLLIAPGAIAFLLTDRLERMLLIATAVAVVCSVAGVYLSFFIDSAPAPTIVLLFTAVFIASFVHCTRQTQRVSQQGA